MQLLKEHKKEVLRMVVSVCIASTPRAGGRNGTCRGHSRLGIRTSPTNGETDESYHSHVLALGRTRDAYLRGPDRRLARVEYDLTLAIPDEPAAAGNDHDRGKNNTSS
jgi:hypothetical protein